MSGNRKLYDLKSNSFDNLSPKSLAKKYINVVQDIFIYFNICTDYVINIIGIK